MYIVLLTYVVDLDTVNRYMHEHSAFLVREHAASTLLLSGPKVPGTGKVIVARTRNRARLEALLQQDPLKQRGLARYDIIEFAPTRVAPELAGLQHDTRKVFSVSQVVCDTDCPILDEVP
ncbi:hypothetical protein JFQ93_001460 [Aeromonas sobria]|nr:hypothetical protein [Aeromonas sobria]